ncbi:hypothetical protein M885DRAFT_521145 [Pelagophyceae sp. CCMP2097]|nr:hypothetical protein M885DRAFT_521145 [Pelagophyceae sp. CCMP2097]|mmetsp:Transcript_15607/g.54485  ORF Transcript_15607/g.54485 Transcript_15607/m.54485 type:complete len:429 (-) Transcript_15607:114-1400(-)
MRLCVLLVLGLGVLAEDSAIPEEEKPIITPAFKWAESDETVELWVKFAHKLDAPAVTGILDDRVSVKYPDAKTVVIEASSLTKKFSLRIPLLDSIDEHRCTFARKTFGILVVLRKRASSRWKVLAPKKQQKAIGIKIQYWHERQLALDTEDEAKRAGATTAWKAFEHKCEVCRELFFAVFRDDAFHTIKELRAARSLAPMRSESYNVTAYYSMRTACDRLSPMIQAPVKIKGASTGTSKWQASADSNPFNALAKENCEAMLAHGPVVETLLETFARFDTFGAKARSDVIFETRMEELGNVCVAAAKACPRKMTPLHRTATKCSACSAVVSVADARLRVRSDKPTRADAARVVDDLCGVGLSERLGEAHVVAATCEALAEDYDEALVDALVSAKSGRDALNFCKMDSFCPKRTKAGKAGKKKKKKTKEL